MPQDIGDLTRTVDVAPQQNDPDVTVERLDLHQDGFVVHFHLGASADRLGKPGLVGLEIRDDFRTRYEHAASGATFVAYRPAIPADAAWLEVLTRPPTRIQLG